MALTHDGRFLVVAALDRLSVYDVQRLTSGADNPLVGELHNDKEPPGYFHVAITASDRFLFASNHNEEAITVIDLDKSRRSNFQEFQIIGKIPIGYGPGSVVLTRDDRYLYATSQIADPSWHWANACRAPGAAASAAPNHPHGAVHVIDVARAVAQPNGSVLTTSVAGCDPVRLVLDPAEERAYVTARGDNALLEFDARRLLSDSARVLLGSVLTHTGPVGVAVLDGGQRVAVANALRFTGVSSDSEVVSIIDPAAGAVSARRAVVGSVPSGGGPADLELMHDGKTLLVRNFEPRALTFLSVRKLPSR